MQQPNKGLVRMKITLRFIFSAQLQQIANGISGNDMSMVAEYAHKVGRASHEETSGALVAKFPVQFR